MATPTKHMFSYINRSIREGWNNPALTNYGELFTYTYGAMATEMARLHLFYEQLGLREGDKIALCGANSSRWAIALMSTFSYGAVAVSILPDFTGADIERLINHSDAQVLFVGPAVEQKVNPANMPALKAVISTVDFHPVYTADPAYRREYEQLNTSFKERYPKGFRPEDVHYREDNLDDLALINYSSGTTGYPKGVMLSYRSLSSNVVYSLDNEPICPGLTLVSMLPLAHMFGMTIELIYQLAGGTHIYFIRRLATPVLMQALRECHPHIILMVPMVLEKIYKKQIKPFISKPVIRLLWHVPGIGTLIRKKIHDKIMEALGGKVEYIISGGAPINPDVERCLMDIRLPYLSGYGMTECGPLIGYETWQHFKARSCGKIVDRMEIRIAEDGEIQVRGENCMTGYYKNQEATQQAFTEDGWMRTGDLGTIDKEGNIFLRGRCKTMILGPSGQNIYPEEIESLLNAQPAIDEALVVSRDNKLHALIYLTDEHVEQMREDGMNLQEAILQAVEDVNRQLPPYSHIVNYEFMFKEFEKTPKRSIKRYLYQ